MDLLELEMFGGGNNFGGSGMPNNMCLWKGYYEQNGQRNEMRFAQFAAIQGQGVFGSGSDNIGQFQIQGNVSNNGDIMFTKQYMGKHAVRYTGRISGSSIDGTWELQGAGTGKFHIEMDSQGQSQWGMGNGGFGNTGMNNGMGGGSGNWGGQGTNTGGWGQNPSNNNGNNWGWGNGSGSNNNWANTGSGWGANWNPGAGPNQGGWGNNRGGW